MVTTIDKYEGITVYRNQLNEQIAGALQNLIAIQELKPGDRLPPERDLAERLKVSRPTIREALRILQSRGLVERRSGRGTYITKSGHGPMIQTMESFYLTSNCNVAELMAVRKLIEPGASELAAIHATPEAIASLEEKVNHLEDVFNSQDVEQLAIAESQFHSSIAMASGNGLLAAILAGIDHLVRLYTKETAHYMFRQNLEMAIFMNKSHREIFDAIRSHDPQRARVSMEEHLQKSEQAIGVPEEQPRSQDTQR